MTQLTTMQVTVTCGSKVATKTINTSIITTNQRPRFTEPDVSALSSRKSLTEPYPGPNIVTNARYNTVSLICLLVRNWLFSQIMLNIILVSKIVLRSKPISNTCSSSLHIFFPGGLGPPKFAPKMHNFRKLEIPCNGACKWKSSGWENHKFRHFFHFLISFMCFCVAA